MNILHIHAHHSTDFGFQELVHKLNNSFQNTVVTPEQSATYNPTDEIRVIHAHSWLTDGAAAQNLHEKWHVPFLVTITEDDCEQLNSWRFKSRNYDILQAARKVIMPSPAIQNKIAQELPSTIADEVFGKMVPLGYGLSPFWIEHLRTPEPVSIIRTRLLFTGTPDKESHIDTLVKAVEILRKRNFEVTLSLVQLDSQQPCGSYVKSLSGKPFVRQLTVQTNNELLECYRSHDILAMPCDRGVAVRTYLQALSQGLPLIYSKEGYFAGLFQEGQAGYAVQPNKAGDIADKILSVSQRYGTLGQHIADLHPLTAFQWNELLPRYANLYL